MANIDLTPESVYKFNETDYAKTLDGYARYRQECIEIERTLMQSTITSAKARFEDAEEQAFIMERVARDHYRAEHPECLGIDCKGRTDDAGETWNAPGQTNYRRCQMCDAVCHYI